MINLQNYINYTLMYSIVLYLYSVYVLYLNKKQADVLKQIERSNKLLEDIKIILIKVNNCLKK